MGVASLTPQLVHDLCVGGALDQGAVGGNLLQGEQRVEEEVVQLVGGARTIPLFHQHTSLLLLPMVQVQTGEEGGQEGGESLLKGLPLHLHQQAKGLGSKPLMEQLWMDVRCDVMDSNAKGRGVGNKDPNLVMAKPQLYQGDHLASPHRVNLHNKIMNVCHTNMYVCVVSSCTF